VSPIPPKGFNIPKGGQEKFGPKKTGWNRKKEKGPKNPWGLTQKKYVKPQPTVN